ncbi:MAG TPA: hypothetical protein VNO54_21785 [Streptosporangiaceae bacterium]|nr:hypothetical protein [Streptosporangiaceae bacterium]
MKRKSVCIAALVLTGSVGSPASAEEQVPGLFPPLSAKLSPTARRGEYLVRINSCHDCHTPWKPGPAGPVPDLSRMLSGHPEQVEVPSAPPLAAPWVVAVAAPNTAYAGPWGTSFSANLTPDKETGLGTWTERNFIEAMRNGRHQGRGRPILPPMPWLMVREHTDSDLKAIWAYLRTIPPIKNRVHDAQPPLAAGSATGTRDSEIKR